MTETGAAEAAARPATEIVAGASRALVIGIGGGGDVVGALVCAGACQALGTDAIVGGLTWERGPVDPLPGPRRLDEIAGTLRPLGPAVALCGPDVTGPGGFHFGESDMARHLGRDTVLVDPWPAPATIATGLDAAAAALECDLLILLDVGGDVLAHGDEPGLSSPLADGLLLAGSASLQTPALLAVFGTGCDGELTPSEVRERAAEIADAGGTRGDLPVPEAALVAAEAALEHVTTEASAMAIRCARGERGRVAIRSGRRSVELTADGGRLLCFDPARALASAARIGAALLGCDGLADGQSRLTALGIETEYDYELRVAG